MKSVQVTGVGQTSLLEVPKPEVGPKDVLLRIRACGICGSDAYYESQGGLPPHKGCQPLGHEPAAEVAAVGKDIVDADVVPGDHVVIDTMVLSDGFLGSGGAQGALSEYVVLYDYQPRRHLKKIPAHIPWHVAALNEPMAVALHGVNRSNPWPGCKVVVFGAGAVGLGAVLAFRNRGAGHIVVVDVIDSRLETASKIGADAVINSSKVPDLAARLMELHGVGHLAVGPEDRPATDIYYDAAGAPPVPKLVAGMAKKGATLAVVGVHKRPVELDFALLLMAEMSIIFSMGYPTEIFEVTDDLVKNWEKYALIVSDLVPHDRVMDAIELAKSGNANKVVVVMD